MGSISACYNTPMFKKPFTNASAAALYIVIIVLVIDVITKVNSGNSAGTDRGTILIPIAMLGLFVLSAAVMGFLFGFEAFQLYFDNKKKDALSFFMKTVGYFSCYAVLFVIVLILYSALV
jgi:membrane protease YdiL (CAAX protease family)